MYNVVIVTQVSDDNVQRQLVDAGYGTRRVSDIDGLLALLDRQHVDVVLLHPSAREEGSMPDLVRRVTRSVHGTRAAVLPMLQRGDLAERVRSLWYGAANVVNLPLREAELLAGIASVTARPRSRGVTGTAAVV